MTPLKIEQNDDGSVTIEGTRYAPEFFRELGCSFPEMVGQTLRIDKKEDGMVTVTRINYKPVAMLRVTHGDGGFGASWAHDSVLPREQRPKPGTDLYAEI